MNDNESEAASSVDWLTMTPEEAANRAFAAWGFIYGAEYLSKCINKALYGEDEQ